MDQIRIDRLVMKKALLMTLSLLALISCEKVWVEDLQERAYDTIRGVYEIDSVVWEEAEPIDIDGDGNASFDYLAEWRRISMGSSVRILIENEGGSLDIPYVVDSSNKLEENASLSRRVEDYPFGITAVIEGGECHLEFTFPQSAAQMVHTGYGEITLRTEVTLDVLTESGKSQKVQGMIFIKYIRTEYRSGH